MAVVCYGRIMRKVFFLIVGMSVFGLLLWGGFTYWGQIWGLGPAVLPPGGDIGDIIEKTPPEQQNTTDFPLRLPEGFSISVFARDLGPARVMTWDPRGNLLVSITKEGEVLALPDRNLDGVADEEVSVIEGLNRPHGLLFFEGKLYIAESNQVAAYDYNEQTLRASNKEKIVDLPSGGDHFTRTIMRAPDDRLLISVGSTCNVCEESDWRRAKILVANMDGSDLKVFASGLRNAVFMTTHYATGGIWVTEMGRDFLGDDLPPDEINIVREGGNYGWPICYGKNIHDTQYDKNTYIRNPCQEPFEVPSHIDLPAHSAPLGMAFVPEDPSTSSGQAAWPEEYWYNLLVAYHGSWNRTEPTGYKVVRLKLDAQGNFLEEEDFISEWLEGSSALGRPVDILAQPGGVMYISDDHAGVIYRVAYTGR